MCIVQCIYMSKLHKSHEHPMIYPNVPFLCILIIGIQPGNLTTMKKPHLTSISWFTYDSIITSS